MNMSFLPKDKDVEKIFDRLTRYPVVRIDPRLTQAISRHKKIRYLRNLDYIYFGMDRIKSKSIIGLPPQIKLKKENGHFIFRY